MYSPNGLVLAPHECTYTIKCSTEDPGNTTVICALKQLGAILKGTPWTDMLTDLSTSGAGMQLHIGWIIVVDGRVVARIDMAPAAPKQFVIKDHGELAIVAESMVYLGTPGNGTYLECTRQMETVFNTIINTTDDIRFESPHCGGKNYSSGYARA